MSTQRLQLQSYCDREVCVRLRAFKQQITRQRRGQRSCWERINWRQMSENTDCSYLMELTLQPAVNGKHPTEKRRANFNHVASFCPHRSDVQRPNTALHRMTRRHFLADFLRLDIHIFNDTASVQHLSHNLNLIWVFFSSPYLSFSGLSPAMLTHPLCISCAGQGKAACPREEKKEGKLQAITGHWAERWGELDKDKRRV